MALDELTFNHSFSELTDKLVFFNAPDIGGSARGGRIPVKGSRLISDDMDDNFRKLRDAGVQLSLFVNDIVASQNTTSTVSTTSQTLLNQINSNLIQRRTLQQFQSTGLLVFKSGGFILADFPSFVQVSSSPGTGVFVTIPSSGEGNISNLLRFKCC